MTHRSLHLYPLLSDHGEEMRTKYIFSLNEVSSIQHSSNFVSQRKFSQNTASFVWRGSILPHDTCMITPCSSSRSEKKETNFFLWLLSPLSCTWYFLSTNVWNNFENFYNPFKILCGGLNGNHNKNSKRKLKKN